MLTGIEEDAKDFSHQRHPVLRPYWLRRIAFENAKTSSDVANLPENQLGRLMEFLPALSDHITIEEKNMKMLKLSGSEFRSSCKELSHLSMVVTKTYLQIEKSYAATACGQRPQPQ